MTELLIATNPDPDSSLDYLLRVPLSSGLVLRTGGTWPRTTALYCHPVPTEEWPARPDIVERIPLRSRTRRGAAIDLIAARSREHRSQQVRTTKRALPGGDDGISLAGALVAAVERKSIADLDSNRHSESAIPRRHLRRRAHGLRQAEHPSVTQP